MPPRLGGAFPVDFAGKPPHMVGRDLGIWSRWRLNLPFPYLGFYFDVALGTPPEIDTELKPEANRAWEFLLARRIDAVGILPEGWHIIEIRRGADQSAIGALKAYGYLWRRDPPDPRPVTLILVTDSMDADSQAFAGAEGITVFLVD